MPDALGRRGVACSKEGFVVSLFHETCLEQRLLSQGLIDRQQLALARKLQQHQVGPLWIILLRLRFIDLGQIDGLLRGCRLSEAHWANQIQIG